MMIGGRAGRLHQEDIFASDVLLNFDEGLAVGKCFDGAFPQLHPDGGGNGFGQEWIGFAAKDFHNARLISKQKK